LFLRGQGDEEFISEIFLALNGDIANGGAGLK